MTITMDNPTTTTTYEYRTVTAPQQRLGLVRDTYSAFGWTDEGSSASPTGEVTLNLKRDRHIKNHSMIADLQRKAETALTSIERLETSKTNKASIVAFTVGILGAAALAGSVFLFQGGAWAGFVLLGIVGLACWAVPYFAYRSILRTTSARVTPLINQQYDAVYDACESAQHLLA